MRKTLFSLFALASAAAFAQTAPPATLEVGDPAPKLAVERWVKGAPVKAFEPGKVYVVEFWATWCGPCKTSIPHLTTLAKKYAGKVNFTGVSVWEKNPADYGAKVDAFVKGMGDQMAYNIATDVAATTPMAKTWMSAAGENGIPSAFVVDQKGQIAWIGHPMGDLDEVLGKVVAKTWDASAFRKERVAAKEKAAERNRLFAPITTALQAKDSAKAIEEIDKLVAEKPEYRDALAGTKWSILRQTDEPKSYVFADDLAKQDGVSPGVLNQIAWTILDDPRLKNPDYAVALRVALAAAKGAGDDPQILDTLGLAYFKTGDKAKAIETQTKAVELAKAQKADADTIKELSERLATFQKG